MAPKLLDIQLMIQVLAYIMLESFTMTIMKQQVELKHGETQYKELE